jgi:hypothetical protein
MREYSARRRPLVERAARIAYTFVVMNCSAVIGLWSMLTRRKVWR